MSEENICRLWKFPLGKVPSYLHRLFLNQYVDAPCEFSSLNIWSILDDHSLHRACLYFHCGDSSIFPREVAAFVVGTGPLHVSCILEFSNVCLCIVHTFVDGRDCSRIDNFSRSLAFHILKSAEVYPNLVP